MTLTDTFRQHQLESEAIADAQQGGTAGFDYLYHRHQRRVYMLCVRMTGNRTDAEELTQEAFLLVFRKIASFRGDAAFSTWLHRLTVNIVLAQLRRKRLLETPWEEVPEGMVGGADRYPRVTAGGETTVVNRIRLQRALHKLRPRDRSIVLLHDVAGYQHDEIAGALGYARNTSKSYLRRAHQKLQIMLRPPLSAKREGRAVGTVGQVGAEGCEIHAVAASPRQTTRRGPDRVGAQGVPGPVERQAGRGAQPPGVPRQANVRGIRGGVGVARLRRQRDGARSALWQSRATLGALLGNPAYGMAHCDAEGRLREGNLALATMLGCASRRELAAALEGGLAPCPGGLPPAAAGSIAPLEMPWRRKDGSEVWVRCSGRSVCSRQCVCLGYQLVVEDLTGQREVVAKLTEAACTDALTGLANYGRLCDVLELELERGRRTGQELALLLLDVDGLKSINDSFGHLAGNRVLVRVADVLKACCRRLDTPARFGGDEFAVVLPETNGSAAAHLVGRIHGACGTDLELPRLGLSIGVATFPAGGVDAGMLLTSADLALYQAKSHARLIT